MILLTAQMQSQSGEPSLLQNPQIVNILQNLVNNADKPLSMDVNELVTKDPNLAAVFRQNNNDNANLGHPQRPALLDTPKTRPILLGNPPMQAQAQQPPAASNPEDLAASNGGLDTSSLFSAQNLNQLLGSLNSNNASSASEVVGSNMPKPVPAGLVSAPPPQAPQQPPPQQQQPLLPTPAAAAAAAAAVSSAGSYYQQRPVLLDASSMAAFNPFLLQQQQQPPQQPQQLYVPQQQFIGNWNLSIDYRNLRKWNQA